MRESPPGAGVSFAHALVRETLYASQPLLRRRTIHQRVAALLAERREVPPNIVASHFALADDPLAIDWLVRSGEQALALYAARDAADALTRAHELAGRFAQPLSSTAYRDRATAYSLLGDFDSARHDHELVLERSRAAGDRHAEWQALIDLGMLWAERDYDRTGRYCQAALDLARSIGDEPAMAHSLNRIANWHVNREAPDLAIPLHQEALAIFERHDDRAGIADTLDLLGMAAYLSGDFPASTAYLERAITQLCELGDRLRLASCLTNLGLTGCGVDVAIVPTFREAPYWYQVLEEGLAIARQIGWTAGEAFANYCLSLVTRARGELGRALQHAAEAERLARQIGHQQWTIASHHGWATLWVDLLQPERAAAELEQGLAAARSTGSHFWTTLTAGGLASALIANGQHDRAALLGSTLQAGGPPHTVGQRQCWLARTELLLAIHEPDQALRVIDVLADATLYAATAPGPALLLKLRGDALAQLHDFEGAEQAYLAARQSAAFYGSLPILWKINKAHGQVLVGQGRPSEAEASFQRARATIEEMAATIADETIREPFRARAFARLPVASTVEQGKAAETLLSPRELDVLRLIVEGQSDRQIADTLSISPRTVMRHVTGILTKLDVTSRTAAATLAIRQNIV